MDKLNISPDRPWLAPLAGFSDLPFRLLCRSCGCYVAVTEMVSAKGLFYNFKSTMEYIRTVEEDSPLIVQLFGEDPEIMGDAVLKLKELGYRYFDLNAGCPVKKVTKTGAGAGLLKDVDNLTNILERMVEVGGEKNIGVKIRLGWDKNSPVYLDIGKIAQQLGLGWIGIHPRFAKQGFSGKADWKCIRELKENTEVPIVASGDLFTGRDGLYCVLETGADSVMFARGALKNPFIFTEYREVLLDDSFSLDEQHTRFIKISLIKKHIDLIKRYGRYKNPILRLRGILARYIRGFEGSKFLRQMAVNVNSWEDVDRIVFMLEEDIS